MWTDLTAWAIRDRRHRSEMRAVAAVVVEYEHGLLSFAAARSRVAEILGLAPAHSDPGANTTEIKT